MKNQFWSDLGQNSEISVVLTGILDLTGAVNSTLDTPYRSSSLNTDYSKVGSLDEQIDVINLILK